MPEIQVASNSLIFPVLKPGQGSDLSTSPPIPIWSSGGDPDVVATVSIIGPFSSAFTVDIVSSHMTVLEGLVTKSWGTSANIPPQPTVGGLGVETYFLQFKCTGPQHPVPVDFSATAIVSWQSGTLQVALSGTTAEITASIATPQPIKFKAGEGSHVGVELTYLSMDATPLAIELSPVQFPTGVEFASISRSLVPQPVQGGLQASYEAVKTFDIDVTSKLLTSQLGNSSGYVHLTIPSLSGFAPQPGVPLKFYVEPRSIETKVSPDQPIVLVPGTPRNATLSITTKGGSTTFKIAKPAHPFAGVTIDYPSEAAHGEIEIGAGTTSTQITINAPYDPASMSPRSGTITLDWTAYDGLSHGTIAIDVEVLQSTLILSSGKLDASATGVDVFGSAVWTLHSNGQFNFSGDARTGDEFEDTFIFAIASQYILVDPTTQAKTAFGVVAHGEASATWNKDEFDPQIIPLWPHLCANGGLYFLKASGIGADIVAIITTWLIVTYYIVIGAIIVV